MSIMAIDSTGVVRCQYGDDIAETLREMGILDVQRASNVEFDNATQGWLVSMAENKSLDIQVFNIGPFQKREDALRWEMKYLEARLSSLTDSEACKIASKEDGCDEDTN